MAVGIECCYEETVAMKSIVIATVTMENVAMKTFAKQSVVIQLLWRVLL